MCPNRNRRRGLTLAELLIAGTIMTMIVGALAALSQAVQSGAGYSQGVQDACQHARVALERITRTVRDAYTAPLHPGVAVVYETSGTNRFPDTLIVWRPSGTPVNTLGPPLVSECVIFCPDPDSPNRLLELRAPSNATPIPLDATLNSSAWRTALLNIKRSSSSQKIVLTDLLRPASPDTAEPAYTVTQPSASSTELASSISTSLTSLRGAASFWLQTNPTATEWTNYQGGTLAWDAIAWPQGIYGSQTGVRQVWLRFELQLAPGVEALANDRRGNEALPFFGSVALYDELTR